MNKALYEKMKFRFILLLGISLPLFLTAQQSDTLVSLENDLVRITISQFGGAISGFTNKKKGINPISWTLKSEQMPVNNQAGAPFRGHFLCIGRWGSPTAGEIAMGIPHNGDHNNRFWRIEKQEENYLKMTVQAPGDHFHIEREIILEENSPVFHVSEKVYNNSTVGRISNMVQHPTLGPPFLNSRTLINTNAGQGFLQKLSYPDPSKFSYRWPEGIADSTGTSLDLRKSDGSVNYVSTHIFDDSVKYGWITAYSPEHSLVYGFIWETAEYPWLNVWHFSQDGSPLAKGLEFGTAGIGRSYQDLLATDTRFRGHNSFEYHDAGELKKKNYICFLILVDQDFENVSQLSINSGKLRLMDQKRKVYSYPLSK